MASPEPLIFISYSTKDEPDPYLYPDDVRWLSYVRSFLKPAEAHGLIRLWDDRCIDGGGAWLAAIDDALERCAVCIFLVSRHSLSSRFILDIEMKRMLERHHERGAHIYPIVITSTDTACAPWLHKLNLKPMHGTALDRYPLGDRNKIMADLAEEIRNIVERAAHKTKIEHPSAIGGGTDFEMAIKERLNPVRHCAELMPGNSNASTYERFELLPELRCGMERLQIDSTYFSLGASQVELRLKLGGCDIVPGVRFGDTPHRFIRAEGGNTWIITGPKDENDALSRRVLGDDVLCRICPIKNDRYNIIMEVGCLQLNIIYHFAYKDRRKFSINKERILGIFINQCLGSEDGFVTLCRTDFDIVGVST
jgi:hypothetical protein